MKLIRSAMAALCVFSAAVLAEPTLTKSPLNSNEKWQIQSQYIDKQMDIEIYLPDGYQTSKDRYPVIYVLDGERYAQMAAGMQKSLSHFSRMPKAIVVGVNFIQGEAQQRRRWLNQQSDIFLDYLQFEVIASIDKHYRTNDDRVFFGWQQAANLGLKAIAQRSDLFDGVIAASMTYMEEAASPVNLIKQYVSQKHTNPTFFYSAIAKSEHWIIPDFDEAKAFIDQQQKNKLDIVFDIYEQEDHWSSAHLTLYRGLRNYYKDYEPLNFVDIAAVNEYGGLPAVLAHYAKRAKRFGVTNKVDPRTQFSMLMSAYKAKDYQAFDSFITTFDDFIATTPLARWGHLFGQYYLENNAPNKAIALFNKNQAKFSSEPVVYADLADAYHKQGDTNKAKANYLKAIELAKAKNDKNLGKYQQKLNDLTTD